MVVVPLLAQQDSTQQTSKRKPADTVKHSYLPTGIRFGTDIISIIRSQTSDKFNGYELNADVDFYRYYLAVDYGTWSHQDSIANGYHNSAGKGYYKNDGHYIRFGGDINFLLKDPDRNMIFIGLRYGLSNYSEVLNYSIPDSVYGQIYGKIPKSISSSGLKGHWFELTSGLRVKIISGLWMGYTIRLKFAPGVSGSGAMKPFDIPGYGLAERAPYWGFNYQVFWRIPFRKIK